MYILYLSDLCIENEKTNKMKITNWPYLCQDGSCMGEQSFKCENHLDSGVATMVVNTAMLRGSAVLGDR